MTVDLSVVYIAIFARKGWKSVGWNGRQKLEAGAAGPNWAAPWVGRVYQLVVQVDWRGRMSLDMVPV